MKKARDANDWAVIRRVGGLEIIKLVRPDYRAVIRRVGGLECKSPVDMFERELPAA